MTSDVCGTPLCISHSCGEDGIKTWSSWGAGPGSGLSWVKPRVAAGIIRPPPPPQKTPIKLPRAVCLHVCVCLRNQTASLVSFTEMQGSLLMVQTQLRAPSFKRRPQSSHPLTANGACHLMWTTLFINYGELRGPSSARTAAPQGESCLLLWLKPPPPSPLLETSKPICRRRCTMRQLTPLSWHSNRAPAFPASFMLRYHTATQKRLGLFLNIASCREQHDSALYPLLMWLSSLMRIMHIPLCFYATALK